MRKTVQAILLDLVEGLYDIHKIDGTMAFDRDKLTQVILNMDHCSVCIWWTVLQSFLPPDYIRHFRDFGAYYLSEYVIFRRKLYCNHGFATKVVQNDKKWKLCGLSFWN